MVTAVLANMTIADYCDAMRRNDIRVNRKYQRSDEVWPEVARAFLIESILMGYPLPKIYLHSFTDLRTRTTIKEIVDGQQRSRTILDFFNDDLRMSRSSEITELRGMIFSELPDEWQEKFISYSLSIDQLVGASTYEVRQIFRRMNSYTVPLNPEEMRNAEYQGKLKWFIYGEAQKHGAVISNLGIFTEKSLVRMQDLKLIAEITHALKHGITTTNKRSLESLYKQNDSNFPEEEDFSAAFEHAFGVLAHMQYISGTNLAKHYMIYSLALALMRQVYPIPGLEDEPPPPAPLDYPEIERRLLRMSAALDLDEERAKQSPYHEFIAASGAGTNVKDKRLIRTMWFLKVLRQEDL